MKPEQINTGVTSNADSEDMNTFWEWVKKESREDYNLSELIIDDEDGDFLSYSAFLKECRHLAIQDQDGIFANKIDLLARSLDVAMTLLMIKMNQHKREVQRRKFLLLVNSIISNDYETETSKDETECIKVIYADRKITDHIRKPLFDEIVKFAKNKKRGDAFCKSCLPYKTDVIKVMKESYNRSAKPTEKGKRGDAYCDARDYCEKRNIARPTPGTLKTWFDEK